MAISYIQDKKTPVGLCIITHLDSRWMHLV